MMNFTLIAAVDSKNGIGKAGDLPWHISADLKHFAATTKEGTVIMGRITWESIPEKYRPFSDRLNIVLTRSPSWDLGLPDSVLSAESLDEALGLSDIHNPGGEIFVIGGGRVFTDSITDALCTKLILTKIDKDFSCDTFFPRIPSDFKLIEESSPQEENGLRFRFLTYERA